MNIHEQEIVLITRVSSMPTNDVCMKTMSDFLHPINLCPAVAGTFHNMCIIAHEQYMLPVVEKGLYRHSQSRMSCTSSES